MVTDSNGRYYWGIDVPGLTADQAAALVVVVGDTFPDLQGLPVDPAEFLTLSMDRATVEILKRVDSQETA